MGYSGGGYTPVSKAIAEYFKEHVKSKIENEKTSLGKLFEKYPDLTNDVATGGATPLHTCGMSQRNQYATAYVIAQGGDIESIDTYGFTPLHRMASNNLAVGAKALLEAGADPNNNRVFEIARESRALDVLNVLKQYPNRLSNPVKRVEVVSSAYEPIIGTYERVDG